MYLLYYTRKIYESSSLVSEDLSGLAAIVVATTSYLSLSSLIDVILEAPFIETTLNALYYESTTL